MPGAAVRKIITGDGGYHCIPKSQFFYGIGYFLRFFFIRGFRNAMGHRAEPAIPGAVIPQDHKGGGSL